MLPKDTFPLQPDHPQSGGLPEAWSGRPGWTVLDTSFDEGQNFVDTWRLWKLDPKRSTMLHYVGIVVPGVHSALPQSTTANLSHSDALHAELAQATQPEQLLTEPGFHRILFEEGRVSLTLCVGELQPMLAEQDFYADTVLVGDGAWDKWTLKLLARRCRRGGIVHTPALGAQLALEFAQVGFRLTPSRNGPGWYGSFNPPWVVSNSRQGQRSEPPVVARCAVVGAGISGATVAHALAIRGWTVTVYDQHTEPAGGASGLPAGLVVPHTSADDSPRSRMSRSGCRLMLGLADRLLRKGLDWSRTGVMEHHAQASDKGTPTAPIWHAFAGWMKPSKLISALLARPGIHYVGQAKVHRMEWIDSAWRLFGIDGQSLGQFEAVVIANALACTELIESLHPSAQPNGVVLDKLHSLQAVHGTLSCGTWGKLSSSAPPPALPVYPSNGNGCFLPSVPTDTGLSWFAGSTFESDAAAIVDVAAQHRANWARLAELTPEASHALKPHFEGSEGGDLAHWSGTRCVTHDRLPLVGPLQSAPPFSLWLSVGMGSRGLSFSALCAELLVARMGGEPLPQALGLVRSLDVHRIRKQHAHPQNRAVAA